MVDGVKDVGMEALCAFVVEDTMVDYAKIHVRFLSIECTMQFPLPLKHLYSLILNALSYLQISCMLPPSSLTFDGLVIFFIS